MVAEFSILDGPSDMLATNGHVDYFQCNLDRWHWQGIIGRRTANCNNEQMHKCLHKAVSRLVLRKYTQYRKITQCQISQLLRLDYFNKQQC